jgi:hypothetical protein
MRFLALALVALSGCATLFDPGPDRVRITSDPPGARVVSRVSGREWTTPAEMVLDRGEESRTFETDRAELFGYGDLMLEVSMPGHVTRWVPVHRSMGAWNVVSMCLIVPGVVDWIAGNHFHFGDETTYHVVLEPAPAAVAELGQPVLGGVRVE